MLHNANRKPLAASQAVCCGTLRTAGEVGARRGRALSIQHGYSKYDLVPSDMLGHAVRRSRGKATSDSCEQWTTCSTV